MKLSDFDFDLPDELIATRPAVPRSTSRLLVANGAAPLADHSFADLPDMLAPGDLLVMNDTKVIPARLFGVRSRHGAEGTTNARIEVTLLGPEPGGESWGAMLKPLRKVKDDEEISFDDNLRARVIGRKDGIASLRFNLSGDALDQAIDAVGQMPLPPYIAAKRAADARDKTDYQTIWARTTGAVAAPTASLHFDQAVLDAIRARGVNTTFVTLHVGAGTFLPVKTDDIAAHKMHSEWGHVSTDAARAINDTLARGKRVIAVGTTALRLIETAATGPDQIAPWTGDTDIFISPGYAFKVTRGLITNFHLPKSTLLMLVSALIGHDRMFEIYDHAIANRYRFFSYGDSSLLLP